MEPLLIGDSSPHRAGLTDLALELAQRSAGFRRSLPESLLASLADLVRSMNCYYSNLIEGHDTHPIDIERAVNGEYSADAIRRAFQLEARAHTEEEIRLDRLPPKSGALLEAALYRGELARGDTAVIVGAGKRPNVRPAASSRRSSDAAYLYLTAAALRCVLPSPQHSPRGGCRDCSRIEPDRHQP
jgi:hypothetical protein